MSIKTNVILEDIKTLTLFETSELVKQIEKTFSVDASPKRLQFQPIHIEEIEIPPIQTEFDVVLAEVPADKKIATLKVVRAITGWDLKSAKDFVESVPQVVKSAIALSDAEDIKQQLEAVGAKVSLN